jgi:hypothetical protein
MTRSRRSGHLATVRLKSLNSFTWQPGGTQATHTAWTVTRHGPPFCWCAGLKT